jgi:hypothetical protein
MVSATKKTKRTKGNMDDWILDLTVQFAPRHEYTDPDTGNQLFSAYGFAQDLIRATEMLNEAGSEPAPLFENFKATGDLQIGDYVFASRWSDCDPSDPWCVGVITYIGVNYVIIGAVSRRCWGYAMRITPEQGERICEAFPKMEGERRSYRKIAALFGYDPRSQTDI